MEQIIKPCVLLHRIQRQISKRTANRIKEYVSCSDKLNSEQLTRNLDSISRYAKRHDCKLSFSPVEDSFENKIKMDVYKKGVKIVDGDDALPLCVMNRETLSGGDVLPKCDSDKNFMDTIRRITQKVIGNDLNWSNKLS